MNSPLFFNRIVRRHLVLAVHRHTVAGVQFSEVSRTVMFFILKNLLTFDRLTKPAQKLPPGSPFLIVHRSFLINKSKITHIEGNRIFIDQAEIPIGSSYRERFMKEIGIG